MRNRTPFAPVARFATWAVVFFSAALATARAVELPAAITLNVPIPANLATPAWLGHPVTAADALADIELPISSPNTDAALLLTVSFTETDGGFLRVIWKSDQGSAVLADNLYENVAMANQRSLLIPPSTLGAGGTLVLQSSSGDLGVQRIKLEWLESRQDLVSPKTSAMLVTPAIGPTVPAESINGQPSTEQPGAWEGDIVTVALATEPVRIEQGVEFSVDLDKVPTTARVALKEAGLPLGQHLVIWVNEQRAGEVTPTVPALGDTGYFTDSGSHTNYVGWRDGTFYVPTTLLRSGVNTIQFAPENELVGAPAVDSSVPLAVKAFSLQLNYQPPPEPELPVLHLSASAAPLPIDSPTPSTPSSP